MMTTQCLAACGTGAVGLRLSVEVEELIRPQQRTAEAVPGLVGGEFFRGVLYSERHSLTPSTLPSRSPAGR